MMFAVPDNNFLYLAWLGSAEKKLKPAENQLGSSRSACNIWLQPSARSQKEKKAIWLGLVLAWLNETPYFKPENALRLRSPPQYQPVTF